jgi:hypothetical protein
MHFQNQQQVEQLNQQNEKLINKLMYIAKRRSNSFFKAEETPIAHYHNPARKRYRCPHAEPSSRSRKATSPSRRESSPNTQNSSPPTKSA